MRKQVVQEATKGAIEVPLRVMRLAMESFPLIREMVETGNPNSITDGAVGALCARTAVIGAFLNVKVNAAGLTDKDYAARVVAEAAEMAVSTISTSTFFWMNCLLQTGRMNGRTISQPETPRK